MVEAVKRLTDALGDEAKARQLDLLISQDRSAQALMDKTLGMSNVVTEENLSVLWQEMLHPHIEDERQKGLEAVNKEKSEGKQRLDRATEKFEALQKNREQESASLGARLETRRHEDYEVVVGLCNDVQRILSHRRSYRVLIGVVIGSVFSVPFLLDTGPVVRVVSFLVGCILAYLTATGGKLFSISTDEKQALKVLHATANRRKLTSKLNQFSIKWNKAVFVIEHLPDPPVGSRRDLFS